MVSQVYCWHACLMLHKWFNFFFHYLDVNKTTVTGHGTAYRHSLVLTGENCLRKPRRVGQVLRNTNFFNPLTIPPSSVLTHRPCRVSVGMWPGFRLGTHICISEVKEERGAKVPLVRMMHLTPWRTRSCMPKPGQKHQ